MEPDRNNRLIITVIIVNMLLATLLLVYIFHVLIFGGIALNGEKPSVTDMTWPMRISIAIISFSLINIQLTMDLILLKNIPISLKAVKTSEHWLKMTTAFQVLQILGFLFSIFHETQDNPYFIMPVIVVTGIVSRAFGLYQVNSFLTLLKAQAPAGLQPGHILFLSLPPQFYRSPSSPSINSIAPYI
ncbi:unnamed protein product [Allacma fusca]|uniref:Uncharacterized protein n=1 Tax=Allacma fusca TaxID=39272 RepID=A0A8J2LGK0_9HEXA|nr:unnamed protein product [Allacma fusca]